MQVVDREKKEKLILAIHKRYYKKWMKSYKVNFQHLEEDLESEFLLTLTEFVYKTDMSVVSEAEMISKLYRLTRWQVLRFINYTGRGAVSIKNDRTARKLQKAGTYISRLEQELQRAPTRAEIADYFGISVAAYNMYTGAMSFSFMEDENVMFTTDDNVIKNIDDKDKIRKAFENVTITNLQKETIIRHFWEDKNYAEITQLEGNKVGRKGVRQRVVFVVNKVRACESATPVM